MHVGGTVYWVLLTRDPDTMQLKDADATPSVVVRKNGASVGDSVTITKRSATTGIYDCSYNPAGEVEGDAYTLEESATVTGTTTGAATYHGSFSVRVVAVERGTDSAATPTNVTATETAILAKLPAALVDGRIDASVGAMASNVITAASLAADAGAEIAALVETYIVNEGDATAVMQAIADKIAADWVAGDASPLAIAAAVWAAATRTITGGSLTTAPPTAAAISALVASDLAAAHGAGSWATATGFSMHSASDVWAVGARTITGGNLTTAPPTAAAIADAVWDEIRTGHTTAGTFGFFLDAAISSISGGGGGGGSGDVSSFSGDAATQINAIQAKTNLLTSGTRVTVTADVGTAITLKIGDDFSAASSTAKRIEVNDADQAIYDLLRDNTLLAREFGAGLSAKRDMVTGTISRDTVTHTPLSGAVPAFTTLFVECSVSAELQSANCGYDVQITDALGKKHTVFSGTCSLVTDYKS